MTRAHMADPHIVRKIVEGREDDIRPCVGATYCLDRIYQARRRASASTTRSTGRELTDPHEIAPAAARKRVVVIGAGPGGLEAARVAAERGHHVVRVRGGRRARRADTTGGAEPPAARILGIIEWRMAQCAALEVAFRFNSWAEPD